MTTFLLSKLLFLLAVIAGVILLALPKGNPLALVKKPDWSANEAFFLFPPSFVSRLELPSKITSDPNLALWRSWSPETQATIGTIATTAFDPPRYMAIPFVGFPNEVPGNRVFIRCVDTHKTLDVAVHRTTNQWQIAYLRIPSRFCLGKVQAVANAVSKSFELGIGTPFAIDAVSYLTNTTFFPRFVVIATAWAILASAILSLAFFLPGLPSNYVGMAGFTLVGAVGVGAFVAFHFSSFAGTAFSWIAVGVPIAALMLAGFRNPKRLSFLANKFAPAGLGWLYASVAYGAYATAIDNGGGIWNINAIFSPVTWLTDNSLPILFAEGLYNDVPRQTITFGPWLASDRTPLLAALLLIFRSTVFPFISLGADTDFVTLLYQNAAVTLLASWTAVFYLALSRFGAIRAGSIVWLAFVTPYFLFDTIYIWPKLLGATYTFCAFWILHRMSLRKRLPGDLTIVATCASLACLCHASMALSLVPLALFFSPTILRAGARHIAVATFLAFLCMAPWIWWQTYIQPHGNALLRSALGNDFGFDKRETPIIDSIRSAYADLTITTWLTNKVHSAIILLGLHVDEKIFVPAREGILHGRLGINRILDFFQSGRFIGGGSVGLILFALTSPFRTDRAVDRLIWGAALSGIAGLILTTLITLYAAVPANEPFGSLTLIFFAGALAIATARRIVGLAILACMTAYSLVVWIVDPISLALRVDAASVAISAIASIYLAILCRVHIVRRRLPDPEKVWLLRERV
jgi:hypothetical protein